MGDCLWGLLDGVNDAGIAVSLTFGGRPNVGTGFGIPIVLRYVLQASESIDAAVDALTRIPVHMIRASLCLLRTKQEQETAPPRRSCWLYFAAICSFVLRCRRRASAALL